MVAGIGGKPGLTTISVEERYKREALKYSTITEVHYTDGWNAWKAEQSILQQTKEFQMFKNNKDGPLQAGSTEIRQVQCLDVIIDYFQELNN